MLDFFEEFNQKKFISVEDRLFSIEDKDKLVDMSLFG